MGNRPSKNNNYAAAGCAKHGCVQNCPKIGWGYWLAGLEESSSSARMSRYESGIHEPPLAYVESIAKVLGISVSYFYCPDDRLSEIIRIYSDLSEAKREKLLLAASQLVESS